VRYAILADVHANLESLRAVLRDAREQADAVVCLGDVVGYGADPVACVDLVAERSLTVVGGDHEHAVTGRLDLEGATPWARASAEWTRDRLDHDHRAWLGGLPLVNEVEDATLVHASPAHPDEWQDLVSAEDGYAAFAAFSTRLCFVGHSHRPATWVQGSWGRAHEPGVSQVTLEAGCRYVVSVGSVGQPRDRDPRAAYALWDSSARRVALRRVPYDVATARLKIVRAGLPRLLADRLAEGC
jgi:diadenosine tetraphosphatase ApaH/serine/threonine PP2A family protein phosphatase